MPPSVIAPNYGSDTVGLKIPTIVIRGILTKAFRFGALGTLGPNEAL